jgi:hypothetical protein
MRTDEQIQAELDAGKVVYLTAEESEAYGKQPKADRECVFLTYSETITHGERTITKTASASVPLSFGCEHAVLGTLRKCVQGTEDVSLA